VRKDKDDDEKKKKRSFPTYLCAYCGFASTAKQLFKITWVQGSPLTVCIGKSCTEQAATGNKPTPTVVRQQRY